MPRKRGSARPGGVASGPIRCGLGTASVLHRDWIDTTTTSSFVALDVTMTLSG
jgi:hypothetical protein